MTTRHSSMPSHFANYQSLTSVLNDPSIRGGRISLFTDKELIPPPLPQHLKHLNEVNVDRFLSFLERYSGLLRTFENNFKAAKLAKRQAHEAEETSNLTNSPSVPHANGLPFVKKGWKRDLKIIPEIFFLPKFSLTDPETFAAVCESKNEFSSSTLLLEKLTHFVDIIEVHLVNQISYRSRSFFTALSHFQHLHLEVARACSMISSIRQRVYNYSLEATKSSLKVAYLRKRRANLVQVYKQIKLIATVHKAPSSIQMLLSTSDYVGALQLIHRTQLILAHRLQGVQCVKHMSSQLQEMVGLIQKMIEAEFLEVVVGSTQDLEVPTEQDETLLSEEVRHQVYPLLVGLLRMDVGSGNGGKKKKKKGSSIMTSAESGVGMGVSGGSQLLHIFQPYRSRLFSTIRSLCKLVVKNHLQLKPPRKSRSGSISRPRTLSDTTEGDSTTIALLSISHKSFIELLSSLFALLYHRSQKTKQVHLLLADVIEEMTQVESGSGGSQLQTFSKISLSNFDLEGTISITIKQKKLILSDSEEFVHTVCELSQNEVANIFKERHDVHTSLSLKNFVEIFQMAMVFIEKQEQLCSNRCYALRGELLSQARDFLERFHATRLTMLQTDLETDRWIQTAVATQFQHIAEEMTTSIKSSEDVGSNGDTSTKKTIVLQNEEFKCVKSALMILKLLKEYILCIQSLPSIKTDILSRIFELLKVYNSLTCQLILGCGAMRTAKLTSISAKHLALASQSLLFIMKLIPHLKTQLDQFFSGTHQKLLLKDFERIEKDYDEHRKEIFNKFTSIMTERLAVHSKTVMDMNWNSKSLPHPSPYVKSLVKETTTLHRVLNSILPRRELQKVFDGVFEVFNTELINTYSKLHISSPAGQQRLQEDIEHFIHELSGVSNVDVGSSLSPLQNFFHSHYDGV